MWAIRSSIASGTSYQRQQRLRGTDDAPHSAASSAAHATPKPPGSRSKAIRRRTTSARSAVSGMPSTSTASAKRSSNCGRRSPSSGFMVPTSTNAAGCAERDSVALDRVDAHRRGVEQRVHQVVRQQVDLVDIQQAPVGARQQARVRSGADPSARMRSRSSVPMTRSSVAPTGSSTNAGGRAHATRDNRAARSLDSGWRLASGAQPKRQPSTTCQRRQQRGETARGGGFGGALLATDQHAAEARVDRVQAPGRASSAAGRRWR